MTALDGSEFAQPASLKAAAPAVMEKVEAVFDPRKECPPLAELALRLLARQKVSWIAIAESYGEMEDVLHREIDCGGFRVTVQFNPRRMASSAAPVDVESLKRRDCFLCLSNLPKAQKAVLYRGSYLLLCNPAPIFPEHYTIAHLDHLPQSIAGHFREFLSLAEDLAPRFHVFYNGPRCGASAPDHFHFQAIPAGSLPIERDLSRPEIRKQVWGTEGAFLFRAEGLGREILILEGRDRRAMDAAFRQILTALAQCMLSCSSPGEEPLLNLLGTSLEGMWRIVIFPRRKHRPEAFYREEEARLVITPAAVEMGGLIVTPREQDYRRLDAGLIRALYEEVSLDELTAQRFLEILATDQPDKDKP